MNFIISITPVVLFISLLIIFDSFKVINRKQLIFFIPAGLVIAVISHFLIGQVIDIFNIGDLFSKRYISPVFDELFKAMLILYLVRVNKIKFLIDAAIYSLAIGAGFSIMENIFILKFSMESSLLLRISQSFYLSILQGGCLLVFSVLIIRAKTTHRSLNPGNVLISLLISMALHSLLNHIPSSTYLNISVYFLIIPVLLIYFFIESENSLRKWLTEEFDSDISALVMLEKSGKHNKNKILGYLSEIKSSFPADIQESVYDYYILNLELSIRAKANIMLKEFDFTITSSEDTSEKLRKLNQLEDKIGMTGIKAISPVFRYNPKDLLKLYR